jgi:creatinine amidohydrolase
MGETLSSHCLADLAYPDVQAYLQRSDLILIPMASTEQHGPHLPLSTDTVLAEAFTRRIVERWGETYDLWQLPPLPAGLSREHDWAPGTVSLSIAGMTAYLRDLGREMTRSLPARNLLIVNGHGGNRGILEALGRELRGDFGLNVGALHLGALISPVSGAAVPEIHAGRDETSAMLALAPELVRKERIAEAKGPSRGDAIHTLVLDPATSWPWSSDDKRIAALGVMGDAREASVEHGNAVVARVIGAADAVLRQLLENRAGGR